MKRCCMLKTKSSISSFTIQQEHGRTDSTQQLEGSAECLLQSWSGLHSRLPEPVSSVLQQFISRHNQNRRIFPSSLISTPSAPLQLLCCVLSVRFVSSSFVTLVFWPSFNGPVARSQLRHNDGLCTSSEQAIYIYRLTKIKPVVSAPCETTVLCLESGDC